MDPTTLLGVDVALFLVVGLLGGAHCIGMCGPLVTVYASRMGSAARPDGGAAADAPTRTQPPGQTAAAPGRLTVYEVRQHALFNVGRAASYTLLGAAFGALGGAVLVTAGTLAGAATLVRGVVGVVAGGLVIGVGLRYLLGGATGGVHLPGLGRATDWLTGHVDRLAAGPGIVLLGAVHGLLPCPILYPAYLYAFATGSAAGGAVALAALGIGTIPAVFAYGTLIDAVGTARRRRLHRLLGVAFLALGYVLFAHGLMGLGVHVPHPRLPFYDPLGGAASALLAPGSGA